MKCSRKRLAAEDRPGGFVAVAAQRTNLGQGAVEGTGNPFHLALEGDGFFVIQTARGERYTRNGGFTLKSDGTLITPQGEPVLGESGPLLISGNKIEVASDGTVRSDQGDIGRLKFVRFIDPAKVFKEGSNLFITDPGNVRARPGDRQARRAGQSRAVQCQPGGRHDLFDFDPPSIRILRAHHEIDGFGHRKDDCHSGAVN